MYKVTGLEVITFIKFKLTCTVALICMMKSVEFESAYKWWTGLLEWLNSGMVNWIVFALIFICFVISAWQVFCYTFCVVGFPNCEGH